MTGSERKFDIDAACASRVVAVLWMQYNASRIQAYEIRDIDGCKNKAKLSVGLHINRK